MCFSGFYVVHLRVSAQPIVEQSVCSARGTRICACHYLQRLAGTSNAATRMELASRRPRRNYDPCFRCSTGPTMPGPHIASLMFHHRCVDWKESAAWRWGTLCSVSAAGGPAHPWVSQCISGISPVQAISAEAPASFTNGHGQAGAATRKVTGWFNIHGLPASRQSWYH